MQMISSGTKSLGSFLKDDIYYVPEYQRSYAWEHNQHEDLWIDLMELYKQPETSTHFFGQVVIFTEDAAHKKYIIDANKDFLLQSYYLMRFGLLLKAFFRNGIADAKYEVEDITTMYIGRTSDNCFEPRLYLNDTDRVFFAERIQKANKNAKLSPHLRS